LVPSNGTAIRKVLLYTAISTSYLVVIVWVVVAECLLNPVIT
jgi:hypothetical protein